MSGRFGEISRYVVGAGLAVLVSLGWAVGDVHAAATVSVTPGTVAPGATITVTGAGWGPNPTMVLVPNGDIQAPPFATTTLDLPNGGNFSQPWSAPPTPGLWGVCVSGTDLQGDGQAPCDTFTVAAPTTTTAPTTKPTIAPTTAPVAASTSTTGAVDTTAVTDTSGVTTSSAAPLVVPPSTAAVTLPPTTPPPTLPPGVDGSSTVDEPPSTVEGSGLTGLAIGGAIGIVVLAGVGVAGLLSSSSFGGPRPKPAIGVGVAGALLAGATLLVAPPPKVNVPKLAITRVQVSQTLVRGTPASTIAAECPTGASTIGGGFTSNWSSWQLDDLQPMVDWMEDPREGNSTLAAASAANAGDPSQPSADYLLWARQDGSVHYSDQVHESTFNSWLSIEQTRRAQEESQDDPSVVVPEPSTIAWSPAKAVAQSHEYYRAVDTLLRGGNARLRTVGLLVTESAPTEHAWRVVAALASNSLQTEATVSVVVLCAPISSERSPDGVPGVALRSQRAAAAVDLTALCQTDEVLTSIGWNTGRSAGLTTAIASAAGTASYRPSGAGGTESVVATCVTGPGVAGTTTTSSTTVSGGFDGGTAASCPNGYTATGGGIDLVLQTYRNGTDRAAQSVLGAAPTGTRTYSAQIRGLLRWAPEHPASGSSLFSGRNGERFIPLTAYADSDRTAMTVQAICLKRVLS